jgi:hypothetical protein
MENDNKKRADRWRECDVNHLAGHFHRFQKTDEDHTSQFVRLGQLYLYKADLDSLFPAGTKIESFHIRLGLDAPNKDNYTFMPEISVKHTDKTLDLGFFYGPSPHRMQPQPADPCVALPQEAKPSAKIPPILKDWLTKNWMELDASLIDDVFTSSAYPEMDAAEREEHKKLGLPIQRTNQRVYAYHFNSKTNKAFFECIDRHKGKIQYLTFHLGVDMNKFAHKEMFSFSPVFEVYLCNPNQEDIRHLRASGLRCIPVKDDNDKLTNDEVAYYEYSAPCPSTCP